MPFPATAVLDTNVLLDWLVFRDHRVAALAAALQGRQLRWLACGRMRQELERMLVHRRLARWTPEPGAALAAFDALVEPQPEPPPAAPGLRCSDTNDQVFVDLALAHRSRWLLTHDRALLRLARRAARHGLTIASPQRWVPAGM